MLWLIVKVILNVYFQEDASMGSVKEEGAINLSKEGGKLNSSRSPTHETMETHSQVDQGHFKGH